MRDEIANSKLSSELMFSKIGEVLFSRDVQNETFLDISVTCEAIFGYSADDFISDRFLWFKIIHPEDRHLAVIGQLKLEKGESVLNQYRIIKKNGSIRWVSVNIVPFQESSGRLLRIDGVSRDITEEKVREIERERMIGDLVNKNTSLARFSYELSHSVRAPLANMIGLSGILQNLKGYSDEQEELVTLIGESASLLDKRIRNLNDLLNNKMQ